MNKKKLTLNQVKEFLLTKGFTLSKKSKKYFPENDIKNLFYTFASSLGLIFFFFVTPLFIEYKVNYSKISKEIKNNSKTKFEKAFRTKKTSNQNEENIDYNFRDLFEDILEFDVLPSDTVRLSASTIEQLFIDTRYNLKAVRETKLVKPIELSLLPTEIRMIENSKKKKNFFIQIILPLVLEENNRIKLDRRKLFSVLNKNHNSKKEKRWLVKKFKQYGVRDNDLSVLKIRMDEIPVSLTIAQAAKETGWGTSRFALEGNALFGQWTWSGEGIKPAAADSDATHKIMKFKILKASVRAYQRNLNTHSSYKEFREVRAELRDGNKDLDSLILADYLDKYAQTGEEYIKIIKKIILQNNLFDFDDAKLLPSSLELKSLI